MTPARRRLLVVALVVVALFAVGRPAAAVAVIVVAGLVTQAARVAPERTAAAEATLSRVLGRAVGSLLLLPVFLVITLVALGGRVLGADPLREDARWARRAAARARRPYGDDRRPAGRGWRQAVALVAVGALAATLLPRLLDDDGADEDIPTRLRGDDGSQAETAPALADAEWLEDASEEFTEAVAQGTTYAPYVGFALQDYEGTHVNITDRQRHSYRADGSDAEALDVWFFGGSTMFGFSAQRDEHTIPSEVVRLAEADGIVVRAHNYGGPGMVNFQETVLFSQLLLGGGEPDLVVFYDGINDRAVQLLAAYAGVGHVGEVGDLSEVSVRQTLAGQVTGNDEPPPPVAGSPPVSSPPAPSEIVAATVDVYERGIRLAQALAAEDEVPVRHFWQPDLYLKDELVPGEEELLDRLYLDPRRLRAMRAYAEATRARLPDGVIDLADAFDGVTEPVMSDQVHTNELGARLVAEAMYEALAPDLRRLAAAG